MLKNHTIPQLNAKALRILSIEADKAIRRNWFHPSDRDDIVQNLAVIVLQRSDRFDPSIASWSTFIRSIVRRALVCMAYRARQAKINRPTCCSLDESTSKSSKLNLGEQLSDEVASRRRGTKSLSESSYFELRHDFSAVMSILSQKQVEVCEALLRNETVTATADECKRARSTIYRRIQSIQTVFRRHELHRHQR